MSKNHTYVKLVCFLLAVASAMLVTGCSKDVPEVDAEKKLQEVLEQVSFAAELSEIEEDAELYFPDLPEGSEVRLYAGIGSSADEVALLTLPSEKDVPAGTAAIETHLNELRSQFQNYFPEEVPKIDQAVIWKNGSHILLCITEDHAHAQDILDGKVSSDDPVNTEKEDTDTENGTDTEEQPAPEAPETPDTAEPQPTEPAAPETEEKEGYPVLKSQSGTYHDYGNGSYVIRVDDKAYELYNYADSSAQTYADLVNRAAEQLKGTASVYALTIPTAIGIVLPDDIAEILPSYTDQNAAIEKVFAKMSADVISVNCYDNMMQHRDEELYFHTDYHWNGRGAYYAYEAFCEAKGIDAIPLEERKEVQFDNFLGQLYWNNSGKDPILAENPDTVYAYYPQSENATMSYTNKNGETYPWKIISDVSNWKSSTKYSTFAGGDNPIAEFTNPDVPDGPVCVIVKESYGNALLPFLVDHYSTIYEIDYRYWTGDLLSFVREKGADDLIFANNLSMIRSNFLIGKLAGILH